MLILLMIMIRCKKQRNYKVKKEKGIILEKKISHKK